MWSDGWKENRQFSRLEWFTSSWAENLAKTWRYFMWTSIWIVRSNWARWIRPRAKSMPLPSIGRPGNLLLWRGRVVFGPKQIPAKTTAKYRKNLRLGWETEGGETCR